MSYLKNNFVFGISILAVLASFLWGYVEGGFEPWIVALFGIVGIFTNKDQLNGVFGRMRNISPERKIALRDKWRPQFEDYFAEMARNDYVGDCIVHDVGRLDNYPNTPEEKGISSWFRVGLIGTYHKGILLGLRWTYICENNEGWEEVPTGDKDDCIKVVLIGEVPYESIESVSFRGDEFYNEPHVYCHFEAQGQPYERLFYGQQSKLFPKSTYFYSEIAEYKSKPQPRWKSKFKYPI